MSKFPAISFELKSPRCTLRPLEVSDTEVLWPFVSDPEISRFMCWNIHENIQTTKNFLQQCEEDLQEGNGVNWAIFLDQEFCGLIGIEIIEKIHDVRLGRGELGYWLGKNFWGQGIIPEVAPVVMAFCFDILELHKITVGHFVENTRSERVIQKLGFRLVGEQKAHFLKAGKWQDRRTYEMLESDFNAKGKLGIEKQ